MTSSSIQSFESICSVPPELNAIKYVNTAEVKSKGLAMNSSTRSRLLLTIFAVATFIPIWSSSAQSSSAEQAEEDIELDVQYPPAPPQPSSCYELADIGYEACMGLGNPWLRCEIERRVYKKIICDCQQNDPKPAFCANEPSAVCNKSSQQCLIEVQVLYEACCETESAFNCGNKAHQNLLICQANYNACMAGVPQLYFADIVPQDAPDLS